jgi:hypothetical protein
MDKLLIDGDREWNYLVKKNPPKKELAKLAAFWVPQFWSICILVLIYFIKTSLLLPCIAISLIVPSAYYLFGNMKKRYGVLIDNKLYKSYPDIYSSSFI